MAVAQWAYNKQKNHHTGTLTPKQVGIIGLFQALAIFGGVSRSGATLSGAYFLGLDRRTSVKLIFLLSIPALLLAAFKDLFSVISNIKNYHFLPTSDVLTTGNISLLGIAFGCIVAYFTALASLRWLLNYLSKNSFLPFVVYRIVLAAILLVVF